jgi:cytosine/adenosine deaminase-related metal-dependent hydrolase
MTIYKAHIIYTPDRQHLEVIENGYIAVGSDGRVSGVAADRTALGFPDAEVVDFDALVIDDHSLYATDYSLPERLERFIYTGDDRHILHRFCRGHEVMEPDIS